MTHISTPLLKLFSDTGSADLNHSFMSLHILTNHSIWIIIILIIIIHIVLFLLIGLKWNRISRTLSARNKELEEMNKKLSESKKRLIKESAFKNKMYSILAHDLRNPTNAIIGFSQLLSRNSDHYSKDDIVKYSLIINRSANNVYRMLDNMLEWSKAQHDYLKIKHETFDLHALALNILTLFELSAYSKKIELNIHIPKGTIIQTDKNILSTILRNLLDNSLKFTPENGKIDLSVKTNHSSIEISVTDNGPGIDPVKARSLFHLKDTDKGLSEADFSTHGLGLILCKDFVDMLKGKIWVESVVGKGSVFTFEIPIC